MDYEYTSSDPIGGHFLIGLPGPELDAATEKLLSEVRPGGIIFFARNIKSCKQTRELIDAIVGFLGYRPIFAVDQEGGLVDRLRRVLHPLPSPSRIKTEENARTLGALAGESLSLLGFDLDLAPVVDVTTPARSNTSNGLYSRAFGSSVHEVVRFAAAFLDGLREFGVRGCLKHFPGLAAAMVDSHNELPIVEISFEELRATDLYPYEKLLVGEATAVMIGHAVYPNAGLQRSDSNGKLLPSSLDPAVVSDLLRGELGFDGLVISDDLEMGAIINHFGVGEASVLALNAGTDMVAICAGPDAIREGVASVRDAAASGRLDAVSLDRSARRIRKFASEAPPLPRFDENRLLELAKEIEAFSDSLV